MYPTAGTDAAPLASVSGTSYDPAMSAILEGIIDAGGTSIAGTVGITSQNATTAPIQFALAPGGERNVQIAIKVDGLSASTAQTVTIEWRVAGGSWATLGSPYTDTGSSGGTVWPGLLELITNTSGATVLYEVRGVTSSTGGTGTVDLSVSFIQA